MRADRLLDLVALLRRHERLSAAHLARRLGVSRRTVLRDLDALSLSGVPVYAVHGRNGGFALVPGSRPEQAGLTPGEATALFLPGGEAAAQALGRGAEFRSARGKLEAVLSDNVARSLMGVHSPDPVRRGGRLLAEPSVGEHRASLRPSGSLVLDRVPAGG